MFRDIYLGDKTIKRRKKMVTTRSCGLWLGEGWLLEAGNILLNWNSGLMGNCFTFALCTFLSFFNYVFIGFREGEKNIDWLPPVQGTLTGNQTQNLGMCPDQELNQQPFGAQADAQPNEPHRTGLLYVLFHVCVIFHDKSSK